MAISQTLKIENVLRLVHNESGSGKIKRKAENCAFRLFLSRPLSMRTSLNQCESNYKAEKVKVYSKKVYRVKVDAYC